MDSFNRPSNIRAEPEDCGIDSEGEVEVLGIDAPPQERSDRFLAPIGFDPSALGTQYR